MKKTLIIIFIIEISFFGYTAPAFEANRSYSIEKLVEIAIKKNPELNAFKAEIDVRKGELRQTTLYLNPQLEVEGARARSLEAPNNMAKEYSIALSQPFEWPLKRLYRKRVAEKNIDLASYELGQFNLNLISQVKTVSYEILRLEEELILSRENLSDLKKILGSIKVRVESGEVPEFELVKAKVEVLRADKELKKAGNKIIIAKSNLNSILGKSLPEDFKVLGELKTPVEQYEYNLLLKLALKNQPFLLLKKGALQMQRFNISYEKNRRFPDVSLRGFFSREIDKRFIGFGFSVPLPLWNRNQGSIAKAFAEKRKAEAELDQITIELERMIKAEFKNYQILIGQIEIFEKGLLQQAKDALRIAKLSYEEGESGMIDLLDAQRVYRQIFFEYYQALYEANISNLRLERLVGGKM